MTPSNEINPQDLQKAATLATGASSDQLRQSLRSHFTDTMAANAAAAQLIQPAPYVPPPPQDTSAYTDTFVPQNPDGLDPGIPIQPPGLGGSNQTPVQVVVTGILNGVAATCTVGATDDPVPL